MSGKDIMQILTSHGIRRAVARVQDEGYSEHLASEPYVTRQFGVYSILVHYDGIKVTVTYQNGKSEYVDYVVMREAIDNHIKSL